MGAERAIPISHTAGAVAGRLPHSRAIFLSFFPSIVFHICQSNDDRLRLTPILRLINTFLLSGSVIDGTSALVLFCVVFLPATYYPIPAHISLLFTAHLGRRDSSLQYLCRQGGTGWGVPSCQQLLGLCRMGEAVSQCATLKEMVQAPHEPAQSSLLKASLVAAGLIFCLFNDLNLFVEGCRGAGETKRSRSPWKPVVTMVLSWVMQFGSGFEPSAELLLVQLPHARNWRSTRDLQDQAKKALGLPFHTSCAHSWRPWPCLEGLTAPAVPGQGQGCPSHSHIVHLICWLQGAKKLCPQCNTITSPGDLRRIYLWRTQQEGRTQLLGSAHHTQGEKNDHNKKRTF